jgi:hypothetical protein
LEQSKFEKSYARPISFLPHDKPLKAREVTAANAQMHISAPKTKMATEGDSLNIC